MNLILIIIPRFCLHINIILFSILHHWFLNCMLTLKLIVLRLLQNLILKRLILSKIFLIITILWINIIDLWKIIKHIHISWQKRKLSFILILINHLWIENKFTYLDFAYFIWYIAQIWIYIFIILCLKRLICI